jgi:hypothetical protein
VYVPKAQPKEKVSDEFEFDCRKGKTPEREERGNAPELLDENGDAGPRAKAQCPFRSTADSQATTYMINGDMTSK